MIIYRAIIKFLNAVLGFSALAFTCGAQSLSSNVVGTAGNEMLSPNATLSYTVGEPCAMFLNAGGHMLTEGFQQNEIIVTSLTQSPESSLVSVYPNPFAASFTIDFHISATYDLTMTDALGRTVDVNKIFVSDDKCTVDMQGFAAGVYFLRLMRNHQAVSVYRLVKSTP